VSDLRLAEYWPLVEGEDSKWLKNADVPILLDRRDRMTVEGNRRSVHRTEASHDCGGDERGDEQAEKADSGSR
jgi:hypothetical protein